MLVLGWIVFFFFKQKTAYEMRISDWSSDVCSSDLHPLYRVLHDSPNADQTAVDFWEFICACLEMHGNAYCETERAIDGRIIALSPPIIPELMSVRRLDNGELEYRWVENGKQRVETQGRIVHIR